LKIVLDTNILSASVSRKSDYYGIFRKFITREYTLCVTTDILQEYEEVIGRHMGKETADMVLQIIENAVNVELVTKYYRWRLITIDPDDNKFVDCAVSCNAKYIVSQDKHFNVLKNIPFPQIDVIDIDEFKRILNIGK